MKPSKPKRPLTAEISEARILQLSNDLSEGIASGTVREWRTVAKYFRHAVDRHAASLGAIRPNIAALLTGFALVQMSQSDLKRWLDTQTPKDP